MKIEIEFDTQYGKFRDAIWFPEGTELPSDAEIEILKQQRLQNWLAAVEAASMVVSEPVPEPVVEPIPQE